jgi:IS30 family transposase
MGKRYQHLSSEERAMMALEHRRGTSLNQIAGMMQRSASTVSRELSRNGAGGGRGYEPTAATRRYCERRFLCGRRRKLVEGSDLHRYVHDHLLYLRWSPEQIAARLRGMYPDDASRQVSHETIYAAIYAYPRGSLKKDMLAALRQAKPRRGLRRRTSAGKTFVPEDLRIVYRPEEVTGRKLPGHWEGDFIKGAYNRSAVGTLVERKTRYVVLCRMGGCTAADALAGFTRQMKKLPTFLRESLTYDRGSEMACFERLAERLQLDIWFADPHAPWQRGSNENTNGLLRQYLPKGTDLSQVSQTQLNDIARMLNGRPRKTLDWKTPEEALAEEMRSYSQRVALDS